MKHGSIITAGLVLAAFLEGCDSPKSVAGTMDESNQNVSARILMPGGTAPAVGAVVQVWRPSDTTKTPVTQVVTKIDGSYSLPQMEAGTYRVVARLPSEQLVAMQDSVPTSGGVLQVHNDTLGKAGTATGYVKMIGDDNPGSVTVVVMGTDVLLNVDRDGKFVIDNLPSGTYRLRLSSTLPDYTLTQVTVKLDFSKPVALDTIAMNYAGIPPVNRFRALYDTLSQRIKLLWDLPLLRGVRDVQIFREDKNRSDTPILVGPSDSGVIWDAPQPDTARTWLYTAKIRKNDGSTGRAAWATVAQPVWKSPTVKLKIDTRFFKGINCQDSFLQLGSAVEVGDTVCLVSNISTPPSTAKLAFSWRLISGSREKSGQISSIPLDTGYARSFSEWIVADSGVISIKAIMRWTGGGDSIWTDTVKGPSIRVDSSAFTPVL